MKRGRSTVILLVLAAALGGYIGRLRKAAQANTPVDPA